MVMKLTGYKRNIKWKFLLTLNNIPAILDLTEEVKRVTFNLINSWMECPV